MQARGLLPCCNEPGMETLKPLAHRRHAHLGPAQERLQAVCRPATSSKKVCTGWHWSGGCNRTDDHLKERITRLAAGCCCCCCDPLVPQFGGGGPKNTLGGPALPETFQNHPVQDPPASRFIPCYKFIQGKAQAGACAACLLSPCVAWGAMEPHAGSGVCASEPFHSLHSACLLLALSC